MSGFKAGFLWGGAVAAHQLFRMPEVHGLLLLFLILVLLQIHLLI